MEYVIQQYSLLNYFSENRNFTNFEVLINIYKKNFIFCLQPFLPCKITVYNTSGKIYVFLDTLFLQSIKKQKSREPSEQWRNFLLFCLEFQQLMKTYSKTNLLVVYFFLKFRIQFRFIDRFSHSRLLHFFRKINK